MFGDFCHRNKGWEGDQVIREFQSAIARHSEKTAVGVVQAG